MINLGYVAWAHMLRRHDASTVATFSLLAPPSGSLFRCWWLAAAALEVFPVHSVPAG
jgi:drug/metabolite transporter (DMT)-like permease